MDIGCPLRAKSGPQFSGISASAITAAMSLRWNISASAGGHLVETLEIGEVERGQAVRPHGRSPRPICSRCCQLLAGIQRLDLGQRQHGNIIGQGHDLLSRQLGGIDDDQDVVEAAVDAVIDAAAARRVALGPGREYAGAAHRRST